jgi:predicted DNA-binding protein (UPF0278 family)
MTNFYAYVEKVRNKKKIKKGRKLAQDYMNAVLRTALKTIKLVNGSKITQKMNG